jgi:hypothetical protein
MTSILRFDEWQDSNGVPVLDGTGLAIPSSALPTGSILQVVQTVKSDTFSTATTSAFVEVTGLNVNITPSKTSSKILVFAVVPVAGNTTDVRWRVGVTIFQNSTNLSVIDSPGSRLAVMGSGQVAGENAPNDSTVMFLDSPNTTSAVNYNVRIAGLSGTNTSYVNRTVSTTDSAAIGRSIATITAIEVAG